MDMQLGRTGGHAGGAVTRHGVRVKRQLRMEIGAARAIDAGLDNHESGPVEVDQV
ncbi:hypothetical protein [Mesorhizobium sp.]|jgi:hypothetical protein|uniref:hypothetical protein n=1 Tax=Mesorhizobium sp. TaxID=1871066 RepID=UPI00257CBCB8|nr:hypothetical protein [Mesorhizobium sp.]